MEQLTPCPFCGFTNLDIKPVTYKIAGRDEWRAWVQCKTCLAEGPTVSSDKSEDEAELLAVTLWNGRKEIKEVERLQLSFAYQYHIGNLSLAQVATALNMSQDEVMELMRKLPERRE